MNEAPTITTTSRTSFTHMERHGYVNTIHTFRATDPEGGDFEWDVAGPDASDFSISETGVLTFQQFRPTLRIRWEPIEMSTR